MTTCKNCGNQIPGKVKLTKVTHCECGYEFDGKMRYCPYDGKWRGFKSVVICGCTSPQPKED